MSINTSVLAIMVGLLTGSVATPATSPRIEDAVDKVCWNAAASASFGARTATEPLSEALAWYSLTGLTGEAFVIYGRGLSSTMPAALVYGYTYRLCLDEARRNPERTV